MIYYMLMFYMIMFIIMLNFLFLYFLINQLSIYLEFEIFKNFSVKMEFLLLFDWISMLFISVVLLISLMVIFYSFEYMKDDFNYNRFIMLIYMFVMSMMLLIISPNLVSILLGWDGLGLVSYCLVIYYQSKSSFNSGMVTILINRLGDIMILISLSLMIMQGSWNYMFFMKMDELIYFLLMMASFTKSAQVPFSSWLPLAMAAPTPVSSLVHSSTLVTAGIYLLIRLNYLLMSDKFINMIMLISIITMLMAGLSANFEFDLKKIIALSTLSQLGVMMFCLSLKLMEVSLFHLLTHAMFKSMLFMCSGIIIHNMLGNQDIRFISMTMYNFPLISLMFNCSSMSLCGIPFLSGFFSKDLILEMFLMNMFNKFIMIILFISMGLTVMYSIRLMFYSFIKIPQLNIYLNYKSIMNKMGISMYLLFMFSIMKGLMLSWIMFSMKNMIYLTLIFKLMIYIFMIIGLMMGLLIPKLFLNNKLYLYCNIYIKVFMLMWFMSILYISWIPLIFKFSNKMLYYLDYMWMEYFLGNNMMKLFKIFYKLDFYNKNYLFLMIMFMFIIIFMIF